MLQNFITREFTEKFKALKGIIADVQIKHLLYGCQKINRCVLHPFVDEERVGLIINEEEKYITMDEMRGADIKNDSCYIKSEVMELYIVL